MLLLSNNQYSERSTTLVLSIFPDVRRDLYLQHLQRSSESVIHRQQDRCSMRSAATFTLATTATLLSLAASFMVPALQQPAHLRFGGKSVAAVRQRHAAYSAAGARRPRSMRPLSMAADFYETLGVQRGADVKDIKSAFRKVREISRMLTSRINLTSAQRRLQHQRCSSSTSCAMTARGLAVHQHLFDCTCSVREHVFDSIMLQ